MKLYSLAHVCAQTTHFCARTECAIQHFCARMKYATEHFCARIKYVTEHFCTRMKCAIEHFCARMKCAIETFCARMRPLRALKLRNLQNYEILKMEFEKRHFWVNSFSKFCFFVFFFGIWNYSLAHACAQTTHFCGRTKCAIEHFCARMKYAIEQFSARTKCAIEYFYARMKYAIEHFCARMICAIAHFYARMRPLRVLKLRNLQNYEILKMKFEKKHCWVNSFSKFCFFVFVFFLEYETV